LKKLSIIFSIISVVLLIILSPNIIFSQLTATNTTTPTTRTDLLKADPQQIKAEIARLQKILEEKQNIISDKDLLATGGGLKLPVIGTTQYDALKNCNPNQQMPEINSTKFQNRWLTYITDFKCGHVTKVFKNNNTALREFTLIADDNFGYGHYVNITKPNTNENNDTVVFPAWMFNNSLPAPTMRMTQGDHVKITVINSNNSKFPHSFHMHSIHSGVADGMTGKGGMINPGENFTYDFIARPFGVYPYHCHMEPVQFHIMRGLYGMMVIDPPAPRPQAKELVMMMNGYSYNQINLTSPKNDPLPFLVPPTAEQLRSTDNREETLSPGGGEGAGGNDNQFYTLNGVAFAFTGSDMLHLVTNRNYRIYLVNMVEFDPVNSFHMHGNMFNIFPSGTSLTPDYLSDIVTLGQGDRTILEFKYLVPGDYMFHSHINRFANLGWLGMFHVTKN
jgi:FtsP/CotA-like multicopper oxidase with cupredoxin domain